MKKELNYRKKYNDLDAGLGYFLVLITPLIIGLILTVILSVIGEGYGFSSYSQSPILLSIYLGLVGLSFLGLFFAYNGAAKINFKRASLFKFKFGWINLLLCVLIAVVTLFGFNYLINYLFHLMQALGYNPDTSLPLPLTDGWWLTINLVVLALIPAICEEVIYRGIILNGLRKFGNINAILISALFFALAHGSAMQFIYQFVLGVVLGFVLIKTGSILASMLVHFINNAIVIVYNFITPVQDASTYTPSTIILSFALAIAAAGLLVLLIHGLKEKSVQNSANEEYNMLYSNSDKRFSSSQSRFIFWLALVVAAALWAIGTFVD